MRFLMDEAAYKRMTESSDLPSDCYVRPGEYPHHLYIDGIKFTIARAVIENLHKAEEARDNAAIRHLSLHKRQLDALAQAAGKTIGTAKLLGDPLPKEATSTQTHIGQIYIPPKPRNAEDTGLNRGMLYELILRMVYNRGRPKGGDIARDLGLSYDLISPILQEMRQRELLDVVGQSGVGEISYEYILKPPRGQQAADDALKKTEYAGPAPVPFEQYRKAVLQQTIKHMSVTRRSIRQAFSDLIITDSILNEIGPAVNSADSIFLFGAPGNGKTSIAERITRLMGDEIFIPYAIEADGQIIRLFDPVVHTVVKTEDDTEFDNPFAATQTSITEFDRRWLRIKRPTIIVGGELTLSMLDLAYNSYGKYYDAPMQMKANNGIFMIDDFGRQLVRPVDLLNRWIIPLEKKYDYLSTLTGNTLQIPFDVLIIFSTNLDPARLADEAFYRRIKFKIEIGDPDEIQYRQIWDLVCKNSKVQLDTRGLDYLLERWYKPLNRPLRMCHPRDLLQQMISIARYNMESVTFSPDLIDAAATAYFVQVTNTTSSPSTDSYA